MKSSYDSMEDRLEEFNESDADTSNMAQDIRTPESIKEIILSDSIKKEMAPNLISELVNTDTIGEIAPINGIRAKTTPDTKFSDSINKTTSVMKENISNLNSKDTELSLIREILATDTMHQPTTSETLIAASEVVQPMCQSDGETPKSESRIVERWSDATSVSSPGMVEDAEAITSDTEPVTIPNEQSEMYYTASSEVSLLSDEPVDPNRFDDEQPDECVPDERRECAIAGHVAAMRERFESMTRTNTPCPDLTRSISPSHDVFRTVTPSPDRFG